MTSSSLRLRLLFAWAVFIFLALQIAGVGLRLLFERSIAHRTQNELEADLRQLRRGMDVSAADMVTILREPTDPQFDIEFGGRYWQIEENGKAVLRSRSLKDMALQLPKAFNPTSTDQTVWLSGPAKQRLLAVVRNHLIEKSATAAARTLTITTAVDSAEIEEDTNKFASDLFVSLLGVAGLLLLGAWAQVTIGLRPLEALRSKVASVREGKAHNLDGDFPDEIMPLVSETNALLDAQQNDLKVARQRAGDLAHGLNTPLAIMSAKSRALRRKGEDEIANDIDAQVDTMHRHVERELARTRARGPNRAGQEAIDVARLTRDLIAAISCIPRDPSIEWHEDLPETLEAGVDTDDFNNIAGNLIENAQKWAKSRVSVSARRLDSGMELDVEDDGPGVPEDQIERVLLRGERLDTSVRGTGLGLAIVNDIVELYRGTLQLSQSALGGLKVSVQLPS